MTPLDMAKFLMPKKNGPTLNSVAKLRGVDLHIVTQGGVEFIDDL